MNMALTFCQKGMLSRATAQLAEALALYGGCEDAFWAEVGTKWRIFDISMTLARKALEP